MSFLQRRKKNSSESPPVESQEHLEKSCVAFELIRDKYDLSADSEVVSFFREALEHRDKLVEAEDDDEEND